MRNNSQHTYNQIVIIIMVGLVWLVGCTRQSKREPDQIPEDVFTSAVKTQKTERSYELHFPKDSINRYLRFSRNPDSAQFNHFNFQISGKGKAIFEDELKILDKLWRMAEDSISIKLNSMMVGYPLEYSDILKNHIEAFKNSEDWKMLSQKPIEENYKLVRQIMLERNVYRPLDSLLNIHGYSIVSFSTEKHGYIPDKDLIEAGYSGDLKIPVPFMVWIEVKKRPSQK